MHKKPKIEAVYALPIISIWKDIVLLDQSVNYTKDHAKLY